MKKWMLKEPVIGKSGAMLVASTRTELRVAVRGVLLHAESSVPGHLPGWLLWLAGINERAVWCVVLDSGERIGADLRVDKLLLWLGACFERYLACYKLGSALLKGDGSHLNEGACTGVSLFPVSAST